MSQPLCLAVDGRSSNENRRRVGAVRPGRSIVPLLAGAFQLARISGLLRCGARATRAGARRSTVMVSFRRDLLIEAVRAPNATPNALTSVHFAAQPCDSALGLRLSIGRQPGVVRCGVIARTPQDLAYLARLERYPGSISMVPGILTRGDVNWVERPLDVCGVRRGILRVNRLAQSGIVMKGSKSQRLAYQAPVTRRVLLSPVPVPRPAGQLSRSLP